MRTFAVAAGLLCVCGAPSPGGSLFAQDAADTSAQRVQALIEERRRLDASVWAEEGLAQQHEGTFVKLWDDLRAAAADGRDQLAVLGAFEHAGVTIGVPGEMHAIMSGVSRGALVDPRRRLEADGVAALLSALRDGGFRLVQSEWHHAQFTASEEGSPAESLVAFTLHAVNDRERARYEVTGRLRVVWSGRADEEGRPIAGPIEVEDVEISRRLGQPGFERAYSWKFDHRSPNDDVLVFDLNRDGLSDVLYPPTNDLLINRGDFRFARERLCDHPTTVVYEAAVADFDGDGMEDLLVAGSNPPPNRAPSVLTLFLYRGDGGGRFRDVCDVALAEPIDLRLPEAMAVGDVDRDGDLDVWLGQYLPPYLDGQFPKPYYDANDGLPAFLLLNDGRGTFTDATEHSGLAPKRFRRTFRASLVDLDDDFRLDLLVVSDFAGIDVYFNDGAGRFTDVSSSAVDETSNFGMSHAFGDFNMDGRLDFYVTGMASTTARRLERMGAERDDLPDYNEARMRIAYGNRMYLAGEGGSFRQPAFNDDVARSGWAWGCAVLDVENDGDPDVYVTNGNLSGQSTRDYCTTFWCHDVYQGQTEPDAAMGMLFGLDARDLSSGLISWNGYEKNRLFLNGAAEGTSGFISAAFLMDVALEEDCRAAVADDFDLDGRLDLLVVAFDRRFTFAKRDMRLMRNVWPDPGHWVGGRLRGAPGVSPVGAKVTVASPGGRQVAAVVTGDSAKSQHSTLRHFGLGDADRVDWIEIRWPDGRLTRLERPEIDVYHDCAPAPES